MCPYWALETKVVKMRLYVGNLPYSCSEEDLKEIFSEFNTSSVKLIIDRETGRSKGFGFVEIDSKEEAERAIKTLDKKVVEGKSLTVNEARPPQKRDDRGGGRDRGEGRPFNKPPRRFGTSRA
jgi:cold-inducible RNA-binding protein